MEINQLTTTTPQTGAQEDLSVKADKGSMSSRTVEQVPAESKTTMHYSDEGLKTEEELQQFLAKYPNIKHLTTKFRLYKQEPDHPVLLHPEGLKLFAKHNPNLEELSLQGELLSMDEMCALLSEFKNLKRINIAEYSCIYDDHGQLDDTLKDIYAKLSEKGISLESVKLKNKHSSGTEKSREYKFVNEKDRGVRIVNENRHNEFYLLNDALKSFYKTLADKGVFLEYARLGSMDFSDMEELKTYFTTVFKKVRSFTNNSDQLRWLTINKRTLSSDEFIELHQAMAEAGSPLERISFNRNISFPSLDAVFTCLSSFKNLKEIECLNGIQVKGKFLSHEEAFTILNKLYESGIQIEWTSVAWRRLPGPDGVSLTSESSEQLKQDSFDAFTQPLLESVRQVKSLKHLYVHDFMDRRIESVWTGYMDKTINEQMYTQFFNALKQESSREVKFEIQEKHNEDVQLKHYTDTASVVRVFMKPKGRVSYRLGIELG